MSSHIQKSLYYKLTLVVLTMIVALSTLPFEGNVAHAATGIKNKVYVGYQGWFGAPGDSSPINRWNHWSGNTLPSPGNQSFEMYPDVREYQSTSLFQTGYANLGNDQPAKLFSSYPTDVVNKHFSWMQSYGIDGAALQRFGNELMDPVYKSWRDGVAVKVKNAAEQNDRGFYIEYDVSGLNDSNFEQLLKDDWTNTIVGQLKLTSSPAYAMEDGKPVVEIWGLGFPSKPGSAEQALSLVNWFKNQGCYVIGGVPRGWRMNDGSSKPNYSAAYDAFDMISPWMVGYVSPNYNDYVQNYLVPDRDYLAARGKAYQPVLYAGFAWSNWNGGARNMIPRNNGAFFWQQAVALRQNGISQGFIAMFDEYDEATAITKAAEDSSMIPTNQYFLTTSADGKFLSSDFYLRLAGKATRMIVGADPLVATVPIPNSLGPVFFRTGLEKDTDAFLTWTNTINTTNGGLANVTGYGGTGSPQLEIVSNEDKEKGLSALRIQGRDNSATKSYAYFQAFEVNIPVSAATKLKYGFLPKDDNGRHVAVDLVMTDGTTLRDSGATTTAGLRMHPGTAKGTVGSWTQIQSNIGTWLNGKTISKIMVAYDQADATGDFKAYIDNIEITN